MYERKVQAALVRSRMAAMTGGQFQSEKVIVRAAGESGKVQVSVSHRVPADHQLAVYNNLVLLFSNDRQVSVQEPAPVEQAVRRRAA